MSYFNFVSFLWIFVINKNYAPCLHRNSKLNYVISICRRDNPKTVLEYWFFKNSCYKKPHQMPLMVQKIDRKVGTQHQETRTVLYQGRRQSF